MGRVKQKEDFGVCGIPFLRVCGTFSVNYMQKKKMPFKRLLKNIRSKKLLWIDKQ